MGGGQSAPSYTRPSYDRYEAYYQPTYSRSPAPAPTPTYSYGRTHSHAPTAPAAPPPDLARFTVDLPTGKKLEVRLPRSSEVKNAIAWLLQTHDTVLGLDVEGHVSLVQFSTPSRALLLHWGNVVASRPAFEALCQLLAGSYLKCGVELRLDAISLLGAHSQARIRNGRDLTTALLRSNRDNSVYGLADAYNLCYPQAQVVKDVEMTCSDWDATSLTQRQLTYAAMDAWLSQRLGLKLLNNTNVAKVDIDSVSPQLAGAFEVVRRIQAARDDAKSHACVSLPVHTFNYGGKWHTVGGDKVLVFRKRLNKRHLGFKRSECLEISLNGSPNKWYAVVGYIRKSTYLLVADPTKHQYASVAGSPEVTGFTKTGRNLETVVEELKELTEPVYSRGRRREAWSPPTTLPTTERAQTAARYDSDFDDYYNERDYERATELGMSYDEYQDSWQHYEDMTAFVDDGVMMGAEGGWGSD